VRLLIRIVVMVEAMLGALITITNPTQNGTTTAITFLAIAMILYVGLSE